MADNLDDGYAQETLGPYARGEWSGLAGAEPFGKGLAKWLENSPGFSADRIRTPLRLHQESGGIPYVLAHWEIFSRLRQLGNPVELYVIPDIDHGTHGTQNPRQCFASQQGAVDWFVYWLKDQRDPAPSKSDQYRGWDVLRHLQNEILKKPRPKPLRWQATEIESQ